MIQSDSKNVMWACDQKVGTGAVTKTGRITSRAFRQKLYPPSSESSSTMSDKITRIAIVDSNRCKPKRCAQECKKVRWSSIICYLSGAD